MTPQLGDLADHLDEMVQRIVGANPTTWFSKPPKNLDTLYNSARRPASKEGYSDTFRTKCSLRDKSASFKAWDLEARSQITVDALKSEVEKFFRPEFINRLDDTVIFQPLVKDDLYGIIDLELEKVCERMRAKGMELVLDDKAKDFIIEKGYNPDFGARPLRRAISTHIEDPLAEALLSGEYHSGLKIVVTHVENATELAMNSEKMPEPAAEEPADTVTESSS